MSVKDKLNDANVLSSFQTLDLYRAVISNAPVLIFAIDNQGKVLLTEGKALHTIGKIEGGSVGLSAFELYKDFPEIIQAFHRVLRGESFSTNQEFNGTVFQIFYSPFKNKKNKVAGGLGVATDITEQTKAEANLKKYAEELVRSNAELEKFALVASHDLKEPLRNVSIYLQLLEREYSQVLDETGREYLSIAMGGADRMQRLIQSLLSYARVSSFQSVIEPFDANEAVESALENLRAQILAADARIEIGKLPQIRAPKEKLSQVFTNILSNALKYRSEAKPKIQIHADVLPNEWIFSIKDNGRGIAPSDCERIFGLFQRLSVGEGHGVGLPIAKKVIEQLGGKMWVKSVLGDGATFYFSIPNPPIMGSL
jgi:PAS domain S-box-containing protein